MTAEFEQARFDTEQKLAGKLDELADGSDIKSLESFAKAYLGMYLDIDKHLPPDERVALLAKEHILGSIWSGFAAVLHNHELLTPEEIGCQYAKDERMAQGYIALAAIDREIRQHDGDLGDLLTDDDKLESLICFHYVDRNELKDQWMDYLASQRPQLFSTALLRLWQAIQDCGVERYPGFREILQKKEFSAVLENLALPVLKTVKHINKKLLPLLLMSAFENVSHEELLKTCQARLNNAEFMTIVHHVYWLGSAYLLSPKQYEAEITAYIGRTREKALPLLNFLESVIKNKAVTKVNIDSGMLASLLAMIAPRFRPGRDQFGRLDDNVQKIVWLFDLLGQDGSEEGRQAIKKLKGIRVMRLYSDFLEKAEKDQQRQRNG
jgi:hypothetical protein